MTYLQLVNNVLTRLREDQIEGHQIDSDPYWRSIGAHVNDAKDRVENAWKWSQLRDVHYIPIQQGDIWVEMQDPGDTVDGKLTSADNHFLIESVKHYGNANFLRWATINWLKHRYANNAHVPVPEGNPGYYGFAPNEVNGNQRITIYPPPAEDSSLVIEAVRHQDQLTDPNTILKVPSLPVFTLATALASRERGEVGGTPTSELFAVADSHLADAIALDSSRFPDEMDWHSSGSWHETNVRTG